jgi:hypothetical protein
MATQMTPVTLSEVAFAPLHFYSLNFVRAKSPLFFAKPTLLALWADLPIVEARLNRSRSSAAPFD